MTHETILGLVGDGTIDGLRIDHPDGLADPADYLWRLRRAGAAHVWVEKILEPGEELRDWPVEGTTGYEFAADVTTLHVDPGGEQQMTQIYSDFTGRREPFATVRDASNAAAGICVFVRGEHVCVIAGLRGGVDVGGVKLPKGRWRELLPAHDAFARLRLLERY